jgi:hypothetical protein
MVTVIGRVLGVVICIVVAWALVGKRTSVEAPPKAGKEWGGQIILGAGQGSTATHLVFTATCRLSFRSFHYDLSCDGDRLPSKRKGTDGQTAKIWSSGKTSSQLEVSGDTSTHEPGSYAAKSALHGKILLELYSPMVRCVMGDNSSCLPMTEVATKLKLRVDELLRGGDELALHDSPYPLMSAYIIEAATRIRGHPPLVMLSTRDARAWVKKRQREHGSDCFCRDEGKTADGSLVDGFDIFGCVERAQARSTRVNFTAADVFVPLARVNAGILAGAYERYNARMQASAFLDVDVFQRESRTPPALLVQEMKRALSTHLAAGAGAASESSEGTGTGTGEL